MGEMESTVEPKAPRRQCAKCPWKVGTDPYQIPGGYRRSLHEGLRDTIAEPGSTAGMGSPIKIMACHETTGGNEKPCVGWLAHQLGPGNNIALRLRVRVGEIDANFELVGPQHETFEATLPRARRRACAR